MLTSKASPRFSLAVNLARAGGYRRFVLRSVECPGGDMPEKAGTPKLASCKK
jgi:hypothetical protein